MNICLNLSNFSKNRGTWKKKWNFTHAQKWPKCKFCWFGSDKVTLDVNVSATVAQLLVSLLILSSNNLCIPIPRSAAAVHYQGVQLQSLTKECSCQPLPRNAAAVAYQGMQLQLLAKERNWSPLPRSATEAPYQVVQLQSLNKECSCCPFSLV